MALVLGIDGGGSKTRALLTDEAGHKLGEGLAGCGNHQATGIDRTLEEIRTAAEGALAQAGVAADAVDTVIYGLAGADREKDFNILRPALAALPFRDWDVVCDTITGLRTGSPSGAGVVLVCGTGTNAAGRNRKGETVQTGGMGYFYGDAAGGSHLAAETFRAAVRSWELREVPSRLTADVPAALGYADMDALVNDWLDRDIYHAPNDLCLVLHRTAEAGDELAARLLRECGRELGLAAASVILRLGGADAFGSAGTPVPVVLTGSVLQRGRSPHLLAGLEEALQAQSGGAPYELVIPSLDPVYGAVMLAMDRLGLPVTAETTARFAAPL